jgi:hypothetical protein
MTSLSPAVVVDVVLCADSSLVGVSMDADTVDVGPFCWFIFEVGFEREDNCECELGVVSEAEEGLRSRERFLGMKDVICRFFDLFRSPSDTFGPQNNENSNNAKPVNGKPVCREPENSDRITTEDDLEQ